MSDDKHLIIQSNNGTTMEASFPAQIKNSTGAMVEAARGMLESDKLTIQTDKQLIIIPWLSFKYVEARSVPAAALRFGVMNGASRVESNGTTPA